MPKAAIDEYRHPFLAEEEVRPAFHASGIDGPAGKTRSDQTSSQPPLGRLIPGLADGPHLGGAFRRDVECPPKRVSRKSRRIPTVYLVLSGV